MSDIDDDPGDGRRREATIVHVDMDAFFAAVEILDNPSLRGKPVVVGGSGDRGVVAAASYEARAYGIHSAMPSVRARRLCPHAVFVHGHFDRYNEFSAKLHQIFHDFTPLVEGISLDEAFLDVAGGQRLFGSPAAIAHAIRSRIRDELRLSASVGVASTKMLAKLASEAAKPKASRAGPIEGPGVFVVEPGRELDFLHPLPIRALWGVGPATADRLTRFGVVTIGDLARVPLDALVAALGSSLGRHLHELAWARDSRTVEPDRGIKSVSHEETYPFDHHELEPLRAEAVRMADAVATRLRKSGLAGRTVSIKVRFHDFKTITRSHTLSDAVDSARVIAEVASSLLDEVNVGVGVRLFGVGVSNLIEGGARQLSLDDTDSPDWSSADLAVDAIRDRFGTGAVGSAALAGRDGLRVKKQGQQQWGPAAPES